MKVGQMFQRFAKLCEECDHQLAYDSDSDEWYCTWCDLDEEW